MGEEETENWVKHYASFHQMLIVGEGDFSFALCLAKSFGYGFNICATSLDSYDALLKKYKNAKINVDQLKDLGASVLHEVDATKMKLYTDLKMRMFDRIIFNFPHAGFHGKEDNVHLINMHRNLLHGFFHNASAMLRENGEIHVTHKTSPPFCHWNLEELASQSSLALFECVDFKIEDYPGYNQKRGAGSKCDKAFPLGKCSTFKFVFTTTIKKLKNRGYVSMVNQLIHQSPQFRISEQLHPTSVWSSLPTSNPVPMNLSRLVDSRLHGSLTEECFWIFDWYFCQVMETFGLPDSNIRFNVQEALRRGHERYANEVTGGTLNGYIILLEELHRLSVSRLAWLEMHSRLLQ
ncbi:hypothetical protein Ancab_024881 [Ancistrocladus abbreviatus]